MGYKSLYIIAQTPPNCKRFLKFFLGNFHKNAGVFVSSLWLCGEIFTKQPHSRGLQTSTQAAKPEYLSSSGIVSSMALFPLPQAGKTVSKRRRDSSR